MNPDTDTREPFSVLNTRDDLRELAERYETVAALDATPETATGVRQAPGSRLPPGMQEILNADEIRLALTAVDDWAEFCTNILNEERGIPAPDSTPARLRTISNHAEHLIRHHDEMLAVAITDDLHEHLRTLRRLAKRAVRRVRTGVTCHAMGCTGQLVSPLGTGTDRTDDALECEKCGHRVPHSVWSSWPRARVTYVTIEHAAKLGGTTVAAVKMRASRMKWRRIGSGRDVRYHVDDVRAAFGVAAS